jgi:hypothetical protein
MKTHPRTPSKFAKFASKPLVTTLGDLVSAAYDAVPGFGRQRAKGTLLLLTRSPLARALTPHLRFVP